MYPRLRIARDLLQDDGVIFVSIDDNEVHNLRQMMNEIFGEENFIGEIIRATGQTTGQDSGGLGSSFDYILSYSKDYKFELGGLTLTEHDLKRFENEDDRGKYAYDQMRKTGSNDRREDRPNMYYAIKDPDGNNVFPIGPTGYESCWRFERKTYLKLVEDDIIIWKKTKKNNEEVWWPYVKYYLEGRTKRPSPLWNDLDGNKKASRDLREMFDGKKLFDFPKPVQMIERIIRVSTNANDRNLILDFFAGSATTAHATLNINNEDGGNRRFICVQIAELTKAESEAFKAGYKAIDQLSKERIRRVFSMIKRERQVLEAELPALKVASQTAQADYEKEVNQLKQGNLFDETQLPKPVQKLAEKVEKAATELTNNEQLIQYIDKMDLGFSVYKLDRSGFNIFKPHNGTNTQQLTLSFQQMTDKPLVDGWAKPDLTTELMLLEGFPLHSSQTPQPQYTENEVIAIASDFNDNTLYLCLDPQLQDETVESLAIGTEDVFICLDDALTDIQKIRLDDKLKLKTV